MISQTAEYALRAVVCLAEHSSAALPTQHISTLTKVPVDYLSKVLQTLARSGVVVSNPGRNGGFQLARRAKDISILDVIRAVDKFQRIETCPLRLEAHHTELCALHKKIDGAIALVEQAFSECTIAQLLQGLPLTEPETPEEAPKKKKKVKPKVRS